MREARVQAYLADVERGLASVRPADRDEALRELTSLLDELASADALDEGLAELGSPEQYAAQVREGLEGPEPMDPAAPQGRILGMPYDFRPITDERVRSHIWDPTNPKLWVPKLWGAGWTVNLGALAVKLRLVRPDDTDERVFDAVPRLYRWLLAGVPLLLLAVSGAVIAARWSVLPDVLPTHWDVTGRPNDWGSKGVALAIGPLLGTLPWLVAMVRVRFRITPLSWLMWFAFAMFLSFLGLATTILAAYPDTRHANLVMIGTLLGGAAIAFALVVAALRAGLRVVWRDSTTTLKEQS